MCYLDSIDKLKFVIMGDISEPESLKIGNLPVTKYLLSNKVPTVIVKSYFENTILRGDYFTLAGAINVVEQAKISGMKKEHMIAALNLVSNFGSIPKARQHFLDKGGLVVAFDRSLYNLAKIGVNPLTMSEDSVTLFIPGLLDSYESLIESPTIIRLGESDDDVVRVEKE
jgi:hypothetical protein